jgi:hypothetical protein
MVLKSATMTLTVLASSTIGAFVLGRPTRSFFSAIMISDQLLSKFTTTITNARAYRNSTPSARTTELFAGHKAL